MALSPKADSVVASSTLASTSDAPSDVNTQSPSTSSHCDQAELEDDTFSSGGDADSGLCSEYDDASSIMSGAWYSVDGSFNDE